jgi:cytochrome c-type biogenesis protein CcmH/NrfF
MQKCRKKLLKCLIFNGLLYSAILSASFLQPFCILSAMLKTFDFQRFSDIKQVLDFQRFSASLRCGVVGQG